MDHCLAPDVLPDQGPVPPVHVHQGQVVLVLAPRPQPVPMLSQIANGYFQNAEIIFLKNDQTWLLDWLIDSSGGQKMNKSKGLNTVLMIWIIRDITGLYIRHEPSTGSEAGPGIEVNCFTAAVADLVTVWAMEKEEKIVRENIFWISVHVTGLNTLILLLIVYPAVNSGWFLCHNHHMIVLSCLTSFHFTIFLVLINVNVIKKFSSSQSKQNVQKS